MHFGSYKFWRTVGVLLLLAITGVWALGASAANDVVDVPFEFYRDSVIVQAKVNGEGPLNMLLDTGVNPSVIDRQTAQAIGLKLSAQGEQGSGSGREVNLAMRRFCRGWNSGD